MVERVRRKRLSAPKPSYRESHHRTVQASSELARLPMPVEDECLWDAVLLTPPLVSLPQRGVVDTASAAERYVTIR